MTPRDAPPSSAQAPSGSGRLLIGRWTVDPELDEVRAGDALVKLEPRKMQLLMALARRPGELVTTEELFDTVWKGVVVTQSSVYQSIAQLRKTLGDESDHPKYIATVPRKGYRLVAPVQPVVPEGAAKLAAASAPTMTPVSAAAAGFTPAVVTQPQWLGWRRRAWVAASAASGVGLVAAGLWWWRGSAPAPVLPVRIAVLPFGDLGEPPNPAFAAGITDELQAALERVAGLRVSARSSSLILTAQGQHAAAIAQRLAVSHVVRGSVRHAGSHSSVIAELVAIDSGQTLWSGQLDRPDGELAAIPAQIARAVTQALQLAPARSATDAASARNFAAMELYFAGVYQLRQMTPESVRSARDSFRRATELDAGFARAHAGLALAWMAGHDFEGLPLRQVVRYAQPVVAGALALDPNSDFAHAVQGYVFLSTLRLADAETHLKRALELNPNYATAQFWRGMTAAFDGRPLDAIPMYLQAGQLDPMNFLVHLLLGHAHIDIGQFQDARTHIGRARELAPRHPNGARSLGALAYAEGATSEAAQSYREAADLNPKRYDIQRELAWLCLDLGLVAEASRAFERAIANAPTLPYLIGESANVHLVAGDLAALAGPIRRLEQFEPKPLPTGAQAGLALLHLLHGDAPTALRLADEVAGMIVADPVTLAGPWETFLGHSVHLDLAAMYVAAGERSKAEALLSDVWRDLDRLERNRVTWHSLAYLEARVLALRGDVPAALSQLERAVARGFRRTWWLPHDPALAALRGDARFSALITSGGSVPPASVQGAATATRPWPRVLWVDDHPENNSKERAALASFGVDITLARSTTDALQQWQGTHFDIVISDMGRLPDRLAGYTLLAELRGRGAKTPYIIYTSACGAAQRAEALGRGATACIDKASELMGSVVAALEKREAAASAPR